MEILILEGSCGKSENPTYYNVNYIMEGEIMQEYIVKPNDTLYLIAKEFDVPLAQLIKANPKIKNPDLIQVGQTITIPNLPDIPEQLGMIESEIISIMDDIFSQDWESAGHRLNQIRTALNLAVPLLQQAEIPNNTIFGLNTAIRILEQNIAQRRAFAAISQANHVAQLLADIYDYFNVIIPTDVMRLAYFARQIIVNVEQKDWAEAYQNYRRAMSVWERLYPELQGEYAGDVSDFNQVLSDLNDAIDKKDYLKTINAANKMLQLTDEISTDFMQQNT